MKFKVGVGVELTIFVPQSGYYMRNIVSRQEIDRWRMAALVLGFTIVKQEVFTYVEEIE